MAIVPNNTKSSWRVGGTSFRPWHFGQNPHRVPAKVDNIAPELGLPKLPAIELRMIVGSELSPAASSLRVILDDVVRERVVARAPGITSRRTVHQRLFKIAQADGQLPGVVSAKRFVGALRR